MIVVVSVNNFSLIQKPRTKRIRVRVSTSMTGEGMFNPFPHSRFVGLIPGSIMNGIAGNAEDEPVLDLEYTLNRRSCEHWSSSSGPPLIPSPKQALSHQTGWQLCVPALEYPLLLPAGGVNVGTGALYWKRRSHAIETISGNTGQ